MYQWGLIALSKCPLEGWIFGAKRATNGTPLTLQNEKSEKRAEVAFEISQHTQLLRQVSAKSVDYHLWPLEHFLRQGHLNYTEHLNVS